MFTIFAGGAAIEIMRPSSLPMTPAEEIEWREYVAALERDKRWLEASRYLLEQRLEEIRRGWAEIDRGQQLDAQASVNFRGPVAADSPPPRRNLGSRHVALLLVVLIANSSGAARVQTLQVAWTRARFG
jgi:hypothetical protein